MVNNWFNIAVNCWSTSIFWAVVIVFLRYFRASIYVECLCADMFLNAASQESHQPPWQNSDHDILCAGGDTDAGPMECHSGWNLLQHASPHITAMSFGQVFKWHGIFVQVECSRVFPATLTVPPFFPTYTQTNLTALWQHRSHAFRPFSIALMVKPSLLFIKLVHRLILIANKNNKQSWPNGGFSK